MNKPTKTKKQTARLAAQDKKGIPLPFGIQGKTSAAIESDYRGLCEEYFNGDKYDADFGDMHARIEAGHLFAHKKIEGTMEGLCKHLTKHNIEPDFYGNSITFGCTKQFWDTVDSEIQEYEGYVLDNFIHSCGQSEILHFDLRALAVTLRKAGVPYLPLEKALVGCVERKIVNTSTKFVPCQACPFKERVVHGIFELVEEEDE